MLTITESLQAITLYPINPATLQNIVEDNGYEGTETATLDVRKSPAFLKAKAQVYLYLAQAPSVSESGATYSFSEDERKLFRQTAADLLAQANQTSSTTKVGYVGENF